MRKSVITVLSVLFVLLLAFSGCSKGSIIGRDEDETEASEQGGNASSKSKNPAPDELKEDECGKHAKWKIENYTLTISGKGAIYDFESTPWMSRRDDIRTITVEDGITSIGNNTFWMCDKVTTVNLPDSVNRIGEKAFTGCSSLLQVKIPSEVTTIEPYCFSGCQKMWSVSLPDTVTVIGDNAFRSCDKLSQINFPTELKSIGQEAFAFCDSLTSCVLPAKVTDLGTNAFLRCFRVVKFQVSQDNSTYCADDNGVLYNEKMDTLLMFPSGSLLKEYTIPDSVKTIAEKAFAYCDGLQTLTIPETVKKISDAAFSNCNNLKTVVLPSNIQTIPKRCFYNSENLTNIEFPDSLTKIGEEAFYGCKSLKDLTIPEKVKTVDRNAFMNCPNANFMVMGKELPPDGWYYNWKDLNATATFELETEPPTDEVTEAVSKE